ncbi:MAG: hypothetical protein QXU88_01280 [Candidatus Woesearchaeota archaeon]
MPKAQPSISEVQDIEATIRDLKNWVFVFAKEYDLPQEAIDMLHNKIDEVASKVGRLTCK